MTGKRNDTTSDASLLHRAFEEKNRQQLLDVLDDPIRRQVLHALDPGEGPVALSDLAERVATTHVRGASGLACQSGDASPADAASDDDLPPDASSVDSTPIDRVALRLHHDHLPRLADYGIVEYDHRSKTVTVKTHS